MARILGVEIPDNKRVDIGLTYIYGIGISRANEVLKATGVDKNKKIKDLTPDELSQIASFIQRNYKIEGALRQEVAQNIKRLIDIGCYRGIRHRLGLPVRGQRTRCNARTRKGPRKTVGVLRKKVKEMMAKKKKKE
ncbi:30S ribosomal protein S13 [Candidatus Calescamantes bacterium]|nr:30S ribosomal protein S13 [Candidatus Calescamantes bacterium]HDO71606.1 30S ribosomal protein S13 [bacterium]HEX68614.1 30S ribosomal protein S13 [bacterium]